MNHTKRLDRMGIKCGIVGGRLFAFVFCYATVVTGIAYAQVALPGAGLIQTLAGNGTAGFVDGPVASAELNRPYGLALDSAGNIYIADFDNSRIRKVTIATGDISTVAGNGGTGICSGHTDSVGDGCPATDANVAAPGSVALDSAGNIYIADYGSNRLRVVNTNTTGSITIAGVTIPAGYIASVAGNGTQAESGDNGLATSAELDGPSGVAVDAAGNIYIADAGGDRIRAINPNSSGSVTIATISIPAKYINTIAGGTVCTNPPHDAFGNGCLAIDASLSNPVGVALDSARNIYIADTSHNEVRKVTASTGYISQLAGDGTGGFNNSDNMLAIDAELSNPYRVAVDAAGIVYIADPGNNRVRAVNTGSQPVTIATVPIPAGYINTVAGDGTLGYSGDFGLATQAELDFPGGVAVDENANIYVADSFNNVLRAVGSGMLVDMDGGTLTGSSSGLSESGATITEYNNSTGTLGTVSFSTGSLASGNLQTGGTFNGGGSVVITTNGSNGTHNGVDFSGMFEGTSAWTDTPLANGTHLYTFWGLVADSSGHSGVLSFEVNTGKGYFNGTTTLSTGFVTF
jgi:sugar lactone lactonase YvrE